MDDLNRSRSESDAEPTAAPTSGKSKVLHRVLVLCVWTFTAVVVFALCRYHPPARLTATLHLKEILFKTSASHILQAGNVRQVLFSRVARLQINTPIFPFQAERHTNTFEILGDDDTLCTVSSVRIDSIHLDGTPVLLSLRWQDQSKSFSISSHNAMSGSLTFNNINAPAVLSCTGMSAEGGRHTNRTVPVSPGTTASFFTDSDARIDFRDPDQVGQDSQIPILGNLIFARTEPGREPISTIVDKSSIDFDDTNVHIDLPGADMLSLYPRSGFYLRKISISEGLNADFHGEVREVLEGSGQADMRSRMPSQFDLLNTRMKILAAIPALVALVIGILRELGWL
jgi:hypothetical protein